MDIRICVSCGAKSFEDKGDYLRCEYCGSEYQKPKLKIVILPEELSVIQKTTGKGYVEIRGGFNKIGGDVFAGNKIVNSDKVEKENQALTFLSFSI